jgi:hypothetical protein
MFEGIPSTDRGGVERDAPARSLDAVEDEIAALASHIHAATYRLLELIYELDARHGWSGFRSCAHWLNWRPRAIMQTAQSSRLCQGQSQVLRIWFGVD